MLTTSSLQKFVTAYKEKYGETPIQFAADAYDAIYAIKAAAEEAGITPETSASDTCDKMKEAMLKITVNGLTGEEHDMDRRRRAAQGTEGCQGCRRRLPGDVIRHEKNDVTGHIMNRNNDKLRGLSLRQLFVSSGSYGIMNIKICCRGKIRQRDPASNCPSGLYVPIIDCKNRRKPAGKDTEV